MGNTYLLMKRCRRIRGHILAVCRNVSGSSAQLHFSEIAVDGTVLTYEASIGGTLNIGIIIMRTRSTP